jgi:hypothetical protein
MKRLMRFNESKSEIDYDYIYQCFGELIDDNKAQIREFENDWNHYVTIDVKVKQFSPEKRDTGGAMKIENSKLLDYINDVKSNTELLEEVEVALMRLSEEYPEYKVNFDVFGYSIHINIFGEEEIAIKYPF